MPPPWTDEELIILIYFSSWGVDPRGIRDLLWEKCGLEREEQPITVKPKDLAHRLSKQRGSRLYKIKWGPFGRKKWDLAVTDELLVEYIEGYAGRLAIGIDKDEGKAPRHYEKVIVKYTKIEPKEAAKVRIPENVLEFIKANPFKAPDWMQLEMEKAWYTEFLAQERAPSPVPETMTDQISGEAARHTTKISGKLALQATPSPGLKPEKKAWFWGISPSKNTFFQDLRPR